MAPKVKKARLEQLVNLEYLELLEKMVPQGTLATKATVANKVYLVHRARKEVLARLAGQVIQASEVHQGYQEMWE